MAVQFDDQTALVTGAASGIGRETAKRLAADGAAVVVADVDVEGGAGTVDRIEDAGGTATFVEADVSDPADVEAMVAETVDTYGGLDVAVNNAGIEGETDPVTEVGLEDWDQLIDVNLRGVWLSMKYELPELVDGGGAIVNTSSIAGKVAAGGVPYVASKHGVIGLTRVAATQYAAEDVRVNAVCPGVIDTPMVDRSAEEDPEAIEQFVGMQPLGRKGDPQEVANLVVWLSSGEASFVTGNAYPVDGGYLAH